ncbi:uncharacterized protein LOC127879375 [Dreissena polymorpha]|uniref:Mitochondria-eating protein C-terminal domain-containing protein n=1 Tax=Dreissena polymorpha TaxID=45954 RepID=A0A9D4QL21_DREPO|nr:uncharacterized protein LOC127879375 [Dreissena polymorpha]XP_052282115.1 uncharacterized protein LOC127879375 [Dreissena polymorpha]KAH3834974.1 hypothetical protein DPMN_108307 [Dreissena polymorpha]
MTVKEDLAYITDLLSDIMEENDYKRRCGKAKTLLEKIKQKFEENEKNIETLVVKNHNTSAGVISDVKIGAKSSTEFQELQTENKRLLVENQNLKQELTHFGNRSGEEKLRFVDKLNDEKKKLQDEVEELSKKLSSVTIADLSDPYRPTKLVEVFGSLYDTQWTDAFSSFEKKAIKEDQVINILREFIKRADRFCTESLLQVKDRIRGYAIEDISNPKIWIRSQNGEKYQLVSRLTVGIESSVKDKVEGPINDLLRLLASVSGKNIADIFVQRPMEFVEKRFLKNETIRESLDTFAKQAVQIIWMMKVQQPPMELLWADPESKYDKQLFSFYVRQGEIVAQCIWPAVLLHKKGPVMARGIVQGK